ncbi:MAG TPA: helical backbone metal receptor [archaeon]|nr:helical backbone metal receptor [archaeon]
MQRNLFIPAVIVLSFLASITGKKIIDGGLSKRTSVSGSHVLLSGQNARIDRIVSMAPSITEVLFALGLGEKLVGVTRYCDYPPEALAKPKVGGYLDPNYEAIFALQPDLVVHLTEQEKAGRFFNEMGLRTLTVDHSDVAGILRSIPQIGGACGAGGRAGELLDDIRLRMKHIQEKVKGLPRPRVMVTVGRNLSYGTMQDIYISGSDGYYNELIELAGGLNAYRERTVAFPAVSVEGIQQLDPQIIIEMIPNLEKDGLDKEKITRAWDFTSGVCAVKDGRVYVFGEDYVVRPGPRFILLLEQMTRAIHPELNWEIR